MRKPSNNSAPSSQGKTFLRTAVRRGNGRMHAGFTLIELLVVIVLIGVLIGITVTGVGVIGGRNLGRAADQITQLFEDARQHAITSGCPTAAVIITNSTKDEVNGRALSILKYTPQNGWKQIRPWGLLPDGYCVEIGINPDASFILNSDSKGLPHAPPNDTPVAFHDTPVVPGQYAFRIFLPKGGVLTTSNDPIEIQVTHGSVKNGVTKTRRQDAVAYRIFLISATGRSKISYPGT